MAPEEGEQVIKGKGEISERMSNRLGVMGVRTSGKMQSFRLGSGDGILECVGEKEGGCMRSTEVG